MKLKVTKSNYFKKASKDWNRQVEREIKEFIKS
jgi:hypothetical protein